MKNITIIIMLLGIAIFAQSSGESQYKTYSSQTLGIEVNVPAGWQLSEEEDTYLSWDTDEDNVTVNIDKYYEDGLKNYSDFSELTAESREQWAANYKTFLEENYNEYYYYFTEVEYVEINNKLFIHFGYEAELDEYYVFDDDYLFYPMYLYEDIYVVMEDGYAYDFYISKEEDMITDDENQMMNEFIKSLKIH